MTAHVIGRTNATRVALVLRDGGPDIVSRVSRALELSRPTVESAMRSLEAYGLVTEVDREPTGSLAGRPARTYAFCPDAGHVVGLDLGPRGVRVALSDLAGIVRSADEVSLVENLAAEDLLAQVARAVRHTCARVGLSPEQLLAVQGALPSTVDVDGRVVASPIIPTLLGWPVADELERLLGAPTRVENDTVLAALTEQHNEGDDLVYVSIGRRLSVALIIDGRPHLGVDRGAGAVANLFGPRVDKLGQLSWHLDPDGRIVLERAAEGDAEARLEVDAVIKDLAHGLAALILTLNPHAVVLGGGIGTSLQPWLDRIEEAIRPEITVPSRIHLRVSPLASRVVVTGATLAALETGSSTRLGEPVPAPRMRWAASEG